MAIFVDSIDWPIFFVINVNGFFDDNLAAADDGDDDE